jgi:hypothetical protein
MTQNISDTRIAVETTVLVAEERHTAYVNAANHSHQQEIEGMRRSAQDALLQQAHQHAVDISARALATAEATKTLAARDSRLRELELALELRENELATVRRDEESAAARARLWVANDSDEDSQGKGRDYHDLSSSGHTSQEGVLASLAPTHMNVFGYKHPISEPTTYAPTVAGYEGSNASGPPCTLYPHRPLRP